MFRALHHCGAAWIAALFFSTTFASLSHAAPGDLDASFDADGRLETSFGGVSSTPLGVVQQGDGRIVAAGSTDQGLSRSFAIARYNANGSLDATFSGDGRATVDFPGADALGQAVAMQAGGKILVAGYLGELGTQMALARLNANGSLDASFGSGGRVTLTVPGVANTNATAVYAMPDGRIVVAGSAFDGTRSLFAVARLNANGTPDTTFSGDGFALVGPPGDSFVEKVVVQPDGKVVVAGFNGSSFVVARLNANGSPDAGFGSGGIVTTNVSAGSSMMGLLLQPDLKIVVTASNEFAGGSDVVLVRYNANGTLDSGFGSGGVTTTNIGEFDNVGDVVLLPNGKLIVAGSVYKGSSYESFLLRYNANGTLDTSFGINGHVTAAMEAGNFFVNGAVRQLDGRIVVAGEYRDQFGLARFLGAPEDALAAGLDQDNDSVSNQVELQEGLNALVKDNDVFNGARLFAMQQYRDFLGREGDAAGATSWTTAIDTGATRDQVILGFFDSPEFQNGLPQIIRLYFAFFDRIPDYAGLLGHVARYRAGTPLGVIANDFAASQEFQNTYGSLNNGQFVDLVYQNVLGRPADPQGRAYWVGQLDSGAMTRGEVMVGFSESDEYRPIIAGEVFVTSVYVGMLRRSPDQAGFDYWLAFYDSGASRNTMIGGFLGSLEYRNRFLP